MQEICQLVETALELPSGRVAVHDGVKSIEEWDSLGLLNILSALEKKFGKAVTKIPELSRVKSVQDIIDVLKREKIV